MKGDIVSELKAELTRMKKGDLLKMVLNQKERNCVLGGICPFLLEYQHILFCVSEVLGQGCQVEKQEFDCVQEAQCESKSSQKPLKLRVGTWLPGFC